jgi:hypothetical protein
MHIIGIISFTGQDCIFGVRGGLAPTSGYTRESRPQRVICMFSDLTQCLLRGVQIEQCVWAFHSSSTSRLAICGHLGIHRTPAGMRLKGAHSDCILHTIATRIMQIRSFAYPHYCPIPRLSCCEPALMMSHRLTPRGQQLPRGHPVVSQSLL